MFFFDQTVAGMQPRARLAPAGASGLARQGGLGRLAAAGNPSLGWGLAGQWGSQEAGSVGGLLRGVIAAQRLRPAPAKGSPVSWGEVAEGISLAFDFLKVREEGVYQWQFNPATRCWESVLTPAAKVVRDNRILRPLAFWVARQMA